MILKGKGSVGKMYKEVEVILVYSFFILKYGKFIKCKDILECKVEIVFCFIFGFYNFFMVN